MVQEERGKHVQGWLKRSLTADGLLGNMAFGWNTGENNATDAAH